MKAVKYLPDFIVDVLVGKKEGLLFDRIVQHRPCVFVLLLSDALKYVVLIELSVYVLLFYVECCKNMFEDVLKFLNCGFWGILGICLYLLLNLIQFYLNLLANTHAPVQHGLLFQFLTISFKDILLRFRVISAFDQKRHQLEDTVVKIQPILSTIVFPDSL